MSQILQVFILIPLVAFLLSLFFPRKNEKVLARFSIFTAALHLLTFAGFALYWLANSFPILDIKHIVFFKADNIEIFVDLYFDKVTAVYAFVGSVITLLVTIFSRFYIHRDEGFKRFFNTLLLFSLGYNFVIFSGNFETLFIGWELLGICSFLLIAFYRDRYLPVKNALKVISTYRVADICLILAMWMSHHLWHENITFFKLNNTEMVLEHLREHNWYAIFIAAMILIAAVVKSALIPFSSWLPRAMEGPTTSSAIFYGSLSVHLGVFLLLRTYPYWESLTYIKVLIIIVGLFTSIIAAGIARVQPTVKTQIAYSSVTQIGLMFIEVALGFHMLALVHFAGNAFLRTYQLLVSPSVLSYLIHDMVFNYKPPRQNDEDSFWARVRTSLYMLSIKEYNMDTTLQRYLWNPFKWLGNRLHFLTDRASVILLTIIFLAGAAADLFVENLSSGVYEYLPTVFSLIGLLLILRSFTERRDAIKAWGLIIAGELFITLSIALLNENFGYGYMLIYLSGSVVAYVIGYISLKKTQQTERNINLDRFHGHAYEHPAWAFLFLISCLALVGLPFTPTFIGMDIMFSHIHKHELLVIFFTSLSFMIIEVAVLRIYARIFMGPHIKAYHPIAFRSS